MSALERAGYRGDVVWDDQLCGTLERGQIVETGEVCRQQPAANQDVEDIRAAFCRAPDAGEYAEAIAVADRWASQLTSLYGTITGRAAQLKQAADALIARGRSKERMEKVKTRIDAAIASIDKIRGYQLQGSNNPLFKAQGTYGVQEHARRQGSCQASEITIDDAYCDNPHPDRDDCRLDCMKGCTVVEIKPASQEDLGRRQAEAYKAGLETMFARLGPKMFEERGMAYFRSCLAPDGKSLALNRVAVETYNFCERMPPESLAVPIPPVDIASEAAE